MLYLFPLVLIAVIAIPLVLAYRQRVKGKGLSTIKKTLIFNAAAFALVVLAAVIVGDKAKPFFCVKPFDSTVVHLWNLLKIAVIPTTLWP